MSNKLEQLTNKLYQEGIEKANQEAEVILSEAQKKAAKILKDAEKKASSIVEKANTDAKNNVMNIESELKLSSNQAVNTLKQKITDLILTKVVEEKVKSSINDIDFVKNLIELTVSSWSKNNSIDPSVIIPSKNQKELETFLQKDINKIFNGKLEIKLDSNIDSGFQIAPNDGSYKVSFTDSDFTNLFKSLLRKSTVEFLFNK